MAVSMGAEPLKYQDERVEVDEALLRPWTVHLVNGLPNSAEGRCPKCSDHCIIRIPIEVVSTRALSAGGEPPHRLTRQFVCNCTGSHDRPSAVTSGCGRWWLATVTGRGTDGYVLTPPSDDTLLPAAVALNDAVTKQDTAVQSSAEKWLAGITALYGLFGLTGVAVGKDSVSQLSTGGKLAVAAAGLVGLSLAALAVLNGYKAAYGWPVVTRLLEDDALKEWKRRRDEYSRTAAEVLHKAVLCAVLSLSALVVATALIWFLPAASPADATLKLSLKDRSVVCGTLVTWASDGTVRLRGKDGNVRSSRAADITKVTVVRTCP
jgi:hypothetical protein